MNTRGGDLISYRCGHSKGRDFPVGTTDRRKDGSRGWDGCLIENIISVSEMILNRKGRIGGAGLTINRRGLLAKQVPKDDNYQRKKTVQKYGHLLS